MRRGPLSSDARSSGLTGISDGMVPAGPPRGVTFAPDNARVADFIDHTLLKPDAVAADVERLTV